jgi:hypothetical protein
VYKKKKRAESVEGARGCLRKDAKTGLARIRTGVNGRFGQVKIHYDNHYITKPNSEARILEVYNIIIS